MPKKPPSQFDAAIDQIIESRIKAVRVRFGPVDPSIERPRDVATQFVANVAASLESLPGKTRLVSSRREIQVSRGDLTYLYYFQALRGNAAGATIVLLPHAGVKSQTLRQWRRGKSHARFFGHETSIKRADDGLFVYGMLGNFFWPHRHIFLEIVDPTDRERLLHQVCEDIRSLDVRLQRDLLDCEAFFNYAMRQDTDIVCMGDNACEYIAAHWGLNAVREFISRVVKSIPNGRSSFRKALDQLSADPSTREPIGWRLRGLVLFTLAHGIETHF